MSKVVEKKAGKIIQYIRKGKNRQKVGILLAIREPGVGRPRIYWSLCRSGDEFSFAEGVAQAALREKGEIPHTVKKELPAFLERCRRYFKTKNILIR